VVLFNLDGHPGGTNTERMRKALVSPRNALLLLGVLIVAMAYLAFQWYRSLQLQVRNESDYAIQMTVGDLDDDHFVVKPHRTGRTGSHLLHGSRVYFSSPDKPYWSWTCAWSDAKSREPLVITNSGPNCADLGSSILTGVPLDLPKCPTVTASRQLATDLTLPTGTPAKATCSG
jgi:hypothetical protein